VRVSQQTETVKLSILFPSSKHPSGDAIHFYYHDNADHGIDQPAASSFDKDDSGGVSGLTWIIANPSTDRSYRVRWDWDSAPPGAVKAD
jgi:hypothetical protein